MKKWDWSKSTEDYYDFPAHEIYYILNRWRDLKLQKVLDLGCGKGRHALLFSEENFDVTATDLSTDAIDYVRQIAERREISLNLVVADMCDLPFKDGEFDALIAYNVISHTDSKGIITVMKELSRVICKGGELFLTFCSKESKHFTDTLSIKIDENTIIKNAKGPEEGIPHYYSDADSLRLLLKDFEIVNMTHCRNYVHNGDVMEDSFHYFVLCRKI